MEILWKFNGNLKVIVHSLETILGSKETKYKGMLFFLLRMLLFRSVCHQVSNQADKLDLLAIFYY